MKNLIKHRSVFWLTASALAIAAMTTGAADPGRSVPREGAELYADLVAMNLDRPVRTGPTSSAPRNWVWHSTAHFLVLTDAPLEWSIEAGRTLEYTRDSFYESFRSAGLQPGPLSGRLEWVAFRHREEFNRYALGVDRQDMSWADGYYSTKTNRVALVCDHHHSAEESTEVAVSDRSNVLPVPRSGFRNLAQTTHEAAHQIAFNSGLQKRGVMYPLWATEGLATNFEAETSGQPIGPASPNGHRRRQLLDALERDALIPLTDFVVMTRPPVSDARATHDAYAQSWAFFRFLFTHRPEELKHYLRHLAALEPGKRDPDTLRHEFIKAFGSTRKLEKSWKAYLELVSGGKRVSRQYR